MVKLINFLEIYWRPFPAGVRMKKGNSGTCWGWQKHKSISDSDVVWHSFQHRSFSLDFPNKCCHLQRTPT